MVGAPAEEPGPRRSGPSGGRAGRQIQIGPGAHRRRKPASPRYGPGGGPQRPTAPPARSSRRCTSSPSRFRWPAGRGVGLRWRLSLSPRTGRRPGRPWLAAAGSCPGNLPPSPCTPLGAGPPPGGGLLPRLCALLGGGTSLGVHGQYTRSDLVCGGREIVSRLPSTLLTLRARPTCVAVQLSNLRSELLPHPPVAKRVGQIAVRSHGSGLPHFQVSEP